MEKINNISRSGSQASCYEPMNLVNDIRKKTESQLMKMQIELRHCQQTIASLSCVGLDGAGQQLVDLAMENSKIRDELDAQLKTNEKLELEKHEAIQKKDNQIDELKNEVMRLQEERNAYFRRCEHLEKLAEEDESRFYQDEMNSSAGNPLQRPERIPRSSNQHDISQLNNLFDRMDLTDADAVARSALNETQAVADHLETHAKRLAEHHSTVVTLYDQLKHTAKFLAQIVNSIGLNSSQVDLLLQKISKLELDLKESNEMSTQLANETKKIVNEMSEMSARIEQSVRQSTVDAGFQSSFLNKPQRAKNSYDLSTRNTDLIKQNELLSSEVMDLKNQLVDLQLEHDECQPEMTSLNKAKRELFNKLEKAMEMIQERDEELQNRQNIIQQLKQVEAGAGDHHNQTPPHDQMKNDILGHLQHIYTTLSHVHQKVHKVA